MKHKLLLDLNDDDDDNNNNNNKNKKIVMNINRTCCRLGFFPMRYINKSLKVKYIYIYNCFR